jgi:hypothetical protein
VTIPRFILAVIPLVAAALICADGATEAFGLTQADRAFIPILRHADDALKSFATVERRQVSDELDLVLVLGSPRRDQMMYGEWPVWSKENRLGLFLQARTDANRVFTLAIEPGPPCQIHLEQVTARNVIISCPGDYDWGEPAENQVFVFDTRSKRMVQRYSYPPFANYALVEGPEALYLVASDLHQVVTAASDSHDVTFRLLPEDEARPVLKRVSVEGFNGIRIPVLPSKHRITFGPGMTFVLDLHNERPRVSDDHPVISERVGKAWKQFPLPQSDRRTWKARRPDDAKNIMPVSAAKISEQIGPYQGDGDRLWFGKTFYDGESVTGVGGFGYFDADSRSYTLYAPPEIWPWSVSALLLEPDALWLGLLDRGEGDDVSGGLLRWDRASKSVGYFDLKTNIHQIVRWSDAVYLATGDGIEVLQGDEVKRYIVDATANGRLQVVACDGGYR